jgi:hypothetical protein
MYFQRNIFLLRGRIEAPQHVEFTGVELAGGAEFVAPVENAMVDLARDVTTPVEKSGPRAGEGRGGQETRWRWRKAGCRALARWRCWPAGPRTS